MYKIEQFKRFVSKLETNDTKIIPCILEAIDVLFEGYVNDPDKIRQIDIFDEYGDKKLGNIFLSNQEIRHFSQSKAFPAKLALNSNQLKELKINADERITISEID